MKKIAFFMSLLFLFYALFPSNVFAEPVKIDRAHFPDASFREYVEKNFDKNEDGVLDDDEAQAVKVLPVGLTYKITSDDYGKITLTKTNDSFPDKISNFKGIEYFINLEALACQNNGIDELDVTKNTKLKFLDCSDNKLEKLNLSEDIELEALFCSDNEIDSLDLGQNKTLFYVDCYNNMLEDILLYQINDKLSRDIIFSGDRWISADVRVKLEDGPLRYLRCDNNSLKSIYLDDNEKLEYIKCDKNQMRKFDVEFNENLRWIECQNCRIVEFKSAENCKKLRYLRCDNNTILELDVGGCKQLETIICDKNRIKEFYLPRRSESLVYLSCSSNNIEYMDNLPATVEYLDCSNNKIDDAYFLKKATSLKTINCSSNLFEEIDLSKMTDLEVLNCDNNRLPEISFANNPSIKSFSGLSQTIHGQFASRSYESKGYPYEYDLTDVVSTKAEFSRIIDIHAFKADNSSINIDRDKTDKEMIYLAEEPAYMTYKFKPDAKLGKNYLEVTLFFDDEDGDYGSSNNDSNDSNDSNVTDTQNENNNRVSRGGSSGGCNSGVSLAGIIALSLISVLKKKK